MSEVQEEQLFTIVNQLNLGRSLITQTAERERLLQLNLTAAQQAKTATAYSAATEYLDICIELLPVDSWQSQPKLTQRIYETAAEVAYLGTNYAYMEQLVAIFRSHPDSVIEQIRVCEIQMLGAKAQGQLQTSLQIGLQLLQRLGVEFPSLPTPADIGQALAQNQLAGKDRAIASLVDLPLMSDPIDLAVMRILTQMIAPAYQSTPLLMPLLIFAQINLCIAKGNCQISAFAYADYGLVLCGILDDLDEGYQFGQLALNILDRFQSTADRCRTYFIVHSYVSHWQESLSSRLPLFREAYQVGIEAGDLESSALTAQMYCAYAYFAGAELSDLAVEMATYRQGLLQLKQETALNYQSIYHQTVLNLLGESDDPCQLSGTVYCEVEKLPLLLQADHQTALYYLYFNKTVLCYLFGQYQQAAEYAVLAESYTESMAGMYAIALCCFYSSSIDLQLYPSMPPQAQVACLDKVAINLAKLQRWADYAPMNHLHKFHLLDAQLQQVLGHRAKAIELYDLAIAGAKTTGYIQEQALANELAAKFYLDWGKSKIAASYLQEAYYCYTRWGATAKTDHLAQSYPLLLAPIFAPPQTAFNSLSTLATITHSFGIRSASSQEVNTFDLVSVIQSAQALSSTIDLEELIHQLSQIILKNSGAETCMLVLPTADDLWQVRAIATVHPACAIMPQHQTNHVHYPANLIYWVKNTQQVKIFDARQPLEIPDLYLREHQPQSVFCLPIIKKAEVLGVLYLEHRQAPDIFTANHQTVISFLCTQAAIALENARLYQTAQIATEHVRTEQSYLAALLDNIPHLAWLRDADSRFIAVNQPFAASCGCEPIDIIGKQSLDHVPVELVQKYRDDDLVVMASGERQVVEERMIDAQGEDRWLEIIKTPIQTSAGKVGGTVGIALDITDRKQMEITLRESEERYAQMVSNVPGTLYQFEVTADGTHRMNYVSPRCAELFELSAESVIADIALLYDRLLPEDRADFYRSIESSAVSRQPWNWAGRCLMPAGTIKWIRAESQPRYLERGAIVWDGILVDVTEQQAALHERNQAQIDLHLTNQHLETANIELKRATRLKDEFLATMSHELRTPLNAILGLSEALQEQIFGAFDERQLKSLRTIERSGRHLLSLINDILDVSKISAGKLELDIAPVSVLSLCHSSLAFVKQQAFDKQLKLDLQLPPVAGKINVDERRMRQVLINLLSNAVKFTPKGGQIALCVTRSAIGDSLDDCSWIEFAVSDTGIGIASDDFDRLFQPFTQLDSSLNRQYEGTGLGLTLVKQIVELHGGSVTVQSQVNLPEGLLGQGGFRSTERQQGSCFTLRLPHHCLIMPTLDSTDLMPFDSQADDSHSIIGRSIVAPLAILLVEDNEANISTFSSYLTAKGYRMIVATDGREAISILESYANNLDQHRPDLILMDIQMPEMNGIEAISWIRHQLQLTEMPIIALTALAMEGDRAKCLAAGANEYLAKPVKLKQLLTTIQQLIQDRGEPVGIPPN